MTETPTTAAPTASATSSENYSLALGWRLSLAISLGIFFFKLLAWTWRIEIVGADTPTLRRRELGVGPGRGRFVFVLWHGEMMATIKRHVPEGLGILVSRSRDGEIIARVLKLVGSISIRGSSSHGGREALIEMVRFMRDGGEGVFTPDGPRGPIHSFAPGAAMAAARAGVPVILMRSAADRAWRFRSWDKLFVPKPFAKVRIAYSDLITVAKAANGSMDKGEPERLGAEMAALGRRIGADD